jgi:phosphatidylglycerophosphatase A
VTRRFAWVLATGLGSGLFPIAPGTAGSAAGLALWWAFHRVVTPGLGPELILVGVLLVAGAWAATEAERALGTTDPGPVVIDEVMGMCLTLVGTPLTWPVLLAGFLLFRVFDVVKPPPARRLERVPAGWGIMLDDLAAGLYAWLVLAAWLALGPAWSH